MSDPLVVEDADGVADTVTRVRDAGLDVVEDPAAAEAAITPDTCAIVAVHNFGNPADMEALESMADRKGLKLIYDAARRLAAAEKC